MAFVYKSQKPSNLIQKNINQQYQSQGLNNQQSQLNGASFDPNQKAINNINLKKIVKGLPSLINRTNSSQNQSKMLYKQNIQMPYEKRKQGLNTQKQRKTPQNYYFTSKIQRSFNSQKLNDLTNKSLTCKQFPKDQLFKKEKQFNSIKTTLGNFVNKNILNTAYDINYTNKNPSLNKASFQLETLLINCSKQTLIQAKGKGAIPKQQRLQLTTKSGFKQNKINTKQKQIVKENNPKEILMKPSSQTKNKQLSKVNHQKRLSNIKKGPLQSSFYRQSSQQESQNQYQNQTPGPGFYDNTINLKQKKTFRSQKQKFSKIFVSPLQRFKQDEIKFHQITLVNDNSMSKEPQKCNQSFLSKSPKFQTLQKRSESPPLGLYNVRNSIEHDIVRNLLRNANIPNFSSSVPRFNNKKTMQSPGPGQYDIDMLERIKMEELKNQFSYSYKSQVKRCFDNSLTDKVKQDSFDTTMELSAQKQTNQLIIHKKVDNFDSSQFFTTPPFMSGKDRFTQTVKDENIKYQFHLPASKSMPKYELRPQPFNSSCKRQFKDNIGEGIGVGSYLIDRDAWNKKSYNVYFH